MFAMNRDEVYPVLLELHELCGTRKLKLATAESCTGGLISSLITALSGSSQYFLGGVCSYSNEAKHSLLDVPWDLIHNHGAVSDQVAVAMALGARKAFACDFALSVTGIAGPSGGTDSKPVGTVYLGFSGEGWANWERLQLEGNRDEIRAQTCLFALVGLHKRILSYSGVSS